MLAVRRVAAMLMLLRRWLRSLLRSASRHAPGSWVRFALLRRVTPVSRIFGLDRGEPIDRYWIERFLARHARDIRGRVLEIADDRYTRTFGGSAVTGSDVLHVRDDNPRATIVADLTNPDGLPPDSFDCVILTQTLQYVRDPHAALRSVYRALKPGGVVLASVPGISQISRYDRDRWGEYWRFTSQSASQLWTEVFPPECVTVETHGNVLAAAAFLYGLAADELRQQELDFHDLDYELVITVRAMKPPTARTVVGPPSGVTFRSGIS